MKPRAATRRLSVDGSGLRLERITRKHDRAAFSCGVPALDNYLKKLARQHTDDGIAVTTVLVREQDHKVLGFYSTCMGSIELETLPDRAIRGLPTGYHRLPVLHLAQLAVDSTVQRAGYGEFLLMNCFRTAIELQKQVGLIGIDLLAATDEVIAFYRRFGFIELRDDTTRKLHMFVSIPHLRKLGL